MLNFTRQERVVIYFLIITLGIGAVIKYVRNQRLDSQMVPARFHEEKQQFLDISEQINSDTLVLVDSTKIENIGSDSQDNSPGISGKINLNTASVDELCELPGIGPAIAKRIKAYTDQYGPFEKIEDIVLVKGIGNKMYTRIQGLVTAE